MDYYRNAGSIQRNRMNKFYFRPRENKTMIQNKNGEDYSSSSLNKEQYLASRAEGGVTLVIAGAGTGKTTTMIMKIKNVIIEKFIPDENILVLTFSRKAADEIYHRVTKEIGEAGGRITTGTFHSFCYHVLKEYGWRFLNHKGFKNIPTVMDDEMRKLVMRRLVKNRLHDFLGIPVDGVLSLINTLNIEKKNYRKLQNLGIVAHMKSINDEFAEYKITHSLIDYDDMIYYTIEILKNDSEIRNKLVNQYRYIFVDEYQDTSGNNFELLNLILPDKDKNLFVVGDDWQSIYGFRDSRVEYLVKIKKYFTDVRIFKLVENFRSRREILRLSGRFISRNRYRTSKKLYSHKGTGGCITIIKVEGLIAEVNEINKVLASADIPVDETAILYRNNWQGQFIMKHSELVRTRCDEGRLILLTMHGSKGLEFKTVIITGISDDILPDPFSQLEEERRLLYVAMTRAKERLYLLYHKGKKREIPKFAKEIGIRNF